MDQRPVWECRAVFCPHSRACSAPTHSAYSHPALEGDSCVCRRWREAWLAVWDPSEIKFSKNYFEILSFWNYQPRCPHQHVLSDKIISQFFIYLFIYLRFIAWSRREIASIGWSESQNAESAAAFGSRSSVKFSERMCEATFNYNSNKIFWI